MDIERSIYFQYVALLHSKNCSSCVQFRWVVAFACVEALNPAPAAPAIWLILTTGRSLRGSRGGNGWWTILVLDSSTAAADGLDRSHDLVGFDIAVRNTAEDDMLAVEPRGDDGCNEELRTIAAAC